MKQTIGTNIAYNITQWTDTFADDFLIEPCTLKRNEGYYHYTSLNNAISILKKLPEKDKLAINKNSYISLFASHFMFLNDSAELLDGLDRVVEALSTKCSSDDFDNQDAKRAKKVLREYIKMFKTIKPENTNNAPNHFILCFCRDGNLLSQWEYYGKECGIAIEFDLDNCEYDGMTEFDEKKPNYPMLVVPRKILYDEQEKCKAIDTLRLHSINDTEKAIILAMRSIAVASYMKHNAFVAEKEVRLLFSPIIFPNEQYADAFKIVDYRESNGTIKPYIKIKIKHKEPGKTPIKSVTVGPGHNQQLVFNAMIKLIQAQYSEKCVPIPIPKPRKKAFLEVTKVGNIEVRRSTIPFRG